MPEETVTLGRDAILSATAAPRIVERITGPGGKGVVFVRALNGEEKSDWEKRNRKKLKGTNGEPVYETNLENTYGRFAVEVLCDEKGTLIFDRSDAGVVAKLDGAFLARAMSVGMRLAGYTEQDLQELEAQEKNS